MAFRAPIMSDVTSKLEKAMQAQQANHLDEARDLYQQVLDSEPHNPDACHGMGLLCAQQKQFQKALPWFEQAVQHAPNSPGFHNNLGNTYKALGQLEQAQKHYQEALKLKSPYPEALNNLGRLFYQQGQLRKAVEYLQKAVREDPNAVDAHYNLANCFAQTDRLLEAATHYRHVLKLRDDHLGALHNLGITLTALKNFKDAQPLLAKVVEREPDNLDALFHLGIIEASIQNLDRAIELYERVLALKPSHADTHHNLATVYLHKKEKAQALEHYKKAYELNPMNKTAFHMIQALEGKTSPEGAPHEYVRALFDQYAYSYDQHVKHQLEYNVPALMRQALVPQVQVMVEPWRVLDLGCGTGLCAPYFRDVAEKLVGVDLSPNMIEVAQQQGGYDSLHVCDLFSFLEHNQEAFQLILAADVLVYLAELAPFFEGCQKNLKAPGLLAFSIETTQASRPFELRSTGRYAHQLDYVIQLGKHYGFDLVTHEEVALRKQDDEPVPGAIVVMQQI